MTIYPADAPILRAAAMRAAEGEAFASGVAQDALMERAGRAVAREVRRLALGRAILVLAGPGNNGGDAFFCARLLREWGCDVAIAALPGRAEGAAARMRAGWSGPVFELADISPRPVIVDGLFGTGLSRPLEGKIADALARLTDDAFVIAIDMPSGVDADAERHFPGAARADVTVALGTLKAAHVVGPDVARMGHVLLADLDIALPDAPRTIARPVIAAPARDAHKYRRGLVTVLAGAMPGAARLAAHAALSAGAGYVVLAGDDAGHGGPDALVRRPLDDPPGLLADHRLAAVLVGPGLGRDEAATRLLDAAMACAAPLVIDGDALSLLGAAGVARVAARSAPTFLTPHSGEFDRMFGEGGGNKIDRTAQAALQARATIVHKGPDTVIASPDGTVTVSPAAPSWLSTAGTGDVLAGILAARLRPGAGQAAREAVWLHGRAAQMAGPALVADSLIDHLGQAIAECR
ncbi:NAD(P)H-hydrate dehydratase [uncultured Sphingomonas sp.]|uniref:NAD(P)H-hydrate dehydratase n=1 Tax=uncultured Sphingomonas sp. TaxID=158754 RepID=UPI0025CC0694|nr:NAD(P)H-hydrate dehydratase [uncultured Sphingomonas sp.]